MEETAWGRRVGVVLLSVVIGVATLFVSPAAEATTTTPLTSLVGLNSHLFWRGDAQTHLDRMAGIGVGQVRESFMWDQIEPTQGAYDWRRADTLMEAAARSGVDVTAVVTHSAPWATSVAGNVDAPPRDAAAFAVFARAVAARYGSLGTFWDARPSLPRRPLAAIEIWNEPWGFWDWAPQPDPAAYAALAEQTAIAVRLADPTLAIAIPADLLQVRTDTTAIRGWIDEVLRARPALATLASAWSVHPYPDPKDQGPLVEHSDQRWDYSQVELVREKTVAAGSVAPLWITEVGWHTAPESSTGVTEQTQATYTRDAIVRAASDWPFVTKLFVYSFGWDGDDPTDAEDHYFLLRADGSAKPAWDAIAALLDEPAPAAPTTTTVAPTTTTVAPTTTTVAPTTTTVAPTTTTTAPAPAPAPPGKGKKKSGYWMVAQGGQVYAFGDAAWFGNAPVGGRTAVDLEPTRGVDGYWVTDDVGHVFTFGSAPFAGGAPALGPGEAVTSISSTPTGKGYWLFTSTGRVLAYGDGRHHGDMAGVRLNAPILDSVATPSGGGYFMVGADGGIFTFGDARFAGSTGNLRLNAPVQSVVPDPDGFGYWLVASDGGIFAFDAPFHGSMGGTRLNRPVTGMVGGEDGYLMVAEDGGIFTFAGIAFHGSLGGTPPPRPVTSVAVV